MGAWGEYDDQNDSVLDEWEEFIVDLINSGKYETKIGELTSSMNEFQDAWIELHLKDIGDEIVALKKRDFIKVGIFMLLARQGTPAGILCTVQGHSIPASVYCHPEAAKAVLPCIDRLLADEKDSDVWVNNKRRLAALRHEKEIAERMRDAPPEQHYTTIQL